MNSGSDTTSGQQVVHWARQVFADGLAEVLAVVREEHEKFVHDAAFAERLTATMAARQPAPFRVGAAPPFGSENTPPTLASGTLLQCEQQRRRMRMDMILESGLTALQKAEQDNGATLLPTEIFALQAIILLYGRPILALDPSGKLPDVPPLWNRLKDQHEEVEVVQQAIGRIELSGDTELTWVGSGFLISETCLLTTRRNLEAFAAPSPTGNWHLLPGIDAKINFSPTPNQSSDPTCPVRSVLGVHHQMDLAVLEIQALPTRSVNPFELDLMMLGTQSPARDGERLAYLVGYSARDSRRGEPQEIADLFDGCFDAKCVRPGLVHQDTAGLEPLLQHDCAALGATAGSCLLDLETDQVLGMHLMGRHGGLSTAIPIWRLQADPLLLRAGAVFTNNHSSDELQAVKRKIDGLSRTHLWQSTRQAVDDLFRQAFDRGDLE